MLYNAGYRNIDGRSHILACPLVDVIMIIMIKGYYNHAVKKKRCPALNIDKVCAKFDDRRLSSSTKLFIASII